MDIVFIEQLTVMAVIGIDDWEQQRLQKLVFDLEIGWDNRPMVDGDNVTSYLNYVDITDVVLSLVSNKSFTLIEHVAEETVEQLMTKFKLTWIRIKISKPGAVPHAANVGVIIERKRQRL